MGSVPIGILTAVQLDEQNEHATTGSPSQECNAVDAVDFALYAVLTGAGPDSGLVIDISSALLQIS
jgi:hypothetical protein